MSKKLDNSVQDVLTTATDTKITTMNGRIDLLVIDKDGKAHLYDWKCSTRPIGQWDEKDNRVVQKNGWWPTTKKLAALKQVGAYGAMLEQYDLSIASMNIIPFHMTFNVEKDSDTGKYKPVDFSTVAEDHPVDKGTTAPVLMRHQLQQMENIFNITRPISIETIRSVNDKLQALFPDTDSDFVHRETATRSVEYFRTKKDFVLNIPEDHSEYAAGKRFMFRRKGLPESGWVFCKDEAELTDKLNKYVEDLTRFVDNEMGHFSDGLTAVLNTQGENQEELDT